MSDAVPVFTSPTPHVRRVSVDRPWAWLSAGWQDLFFAPRLSLTFGLILVGISFALTLGLILTGYIYLLLPLAAGFFLVAPILAVGIYEISRRRVSGESVSLTDTCCAWRRNRTQIALMGLVLMLINLFWVRLATLLFALFFEGTNPPLDELVNTILFSPVSLPFLVIGTIIGAGLAAGTFVIGVISIPMLLDRDVNVFTAIATSYVVVRENRAAMALWAGLIVVFTSIGIATLYVGLAVTVPLIAHASWHAYKDLVE